MMMMMMITIINLITLPAKAVLCVDYFLIVDLSFEESGFLMCILFVACCCWSAVESKMFSNVSLTFNNLQSFASGCLLRKLWHKYPCVDLVTYYQQQCDG